MHCPIADYRQVIGRISGRYLNWEDADFRHPRLWIPEELYAYFDKTSEMCDKVR